MTLSEWKSVVADMLERWPNTAMGENTVEVWFSAVEDLPRELGAASVEALFPDGREVAPNSGQVRVKGLELAAPTQDWLEGWRLVHEAIHRFGQPDEAGALALLDERSPAAATVVRRIGWRSICTYDLDDEGMW